MAKRVKGPDGKVINFPDNMDDASIDREMRKIYGGSQSQERAPAPTERKSTGWSGVGSGLMGAAQGLTFGFADELAAFTQSLVSEEKYDDIVKRRRKDFADAEADNPTAYNTGDVGASVATAFIPGIGAAGNLARGASLAGRAGRAAMSGAALGGLRGAGDADSGVGNTLMGAANGALLGGAIGGGLPIAGRAVGGAGRMANNLMNDAVRMGGNVVDNLSTSPLGGAARKAAVAGPMLDNTVDRGTDFLAARGMNRAAEGLGDFYANTVGGSSGLLARGAASAMMPGIVPAELAARAGAYGAQGAGRLAQSQTLNNVLAQQSARQDPQIAADQENGSEAAQMSDEEILARAQGTSFAPILNEAAQRGERALKARLFVLRQNPKFRQEIGM